MMVESESELCNRGNNTSYMYLDVRLTPEREYLLITHIPLLFRAKVCVVTYLLVLLC
jgi:hypothetical protein